MSKRRHNFGTKRFKEKSLFIFHARIALKSLILLFVRLIARGARIGKTHTHTHRQDKYCNPRACAPRVNYSYDKRPGCRLLEWALRRDNYILKIRRKRIGGFISIALETPTFGSFVSSLLATVSDIYDAWRNQLGPRSVSVPSV